MKIAERHMRFPKKRYIQKDPRLNRGWQLKPYVILMKVRIRKEKIDSRVRGNDESLFRAGAESFKRNISNLVLVVDDDGNASEEVRPVS